MSGIIRKKEPGEAWESVADTDSGGGGGLPTGWTQEGDPADVNTNGGSLIAEGASSFSQINPSGLFATSKAADGFVSVEGIGGVVSAPDTSDGSPPCFTAGGGHGATVALDAGGLDIINAHVVHALDAESGGGDELLLRGGDSTDGLYPGSKLTLGPGDDGGGGTPSGGSASLRGGSPDDVGDGGQVSIIGAGGHGGGNVGGHVSIKAGGGSGGATNGSLLLLSPGGQQVIAIEQSTDVLLGFFDTPPVAQPVIPLTTPDVQDVIDALVALGLVAQHD